MIRDIISAALTQVIQQQLADAVGDTWCNPSFTVLFPDMELVSPTWESDTGEWEVLFELRGPLLIRLYSDEQLPIDPLPLLIALFDSPLRIVPTASDFEPGVVTVQLVWKPGQFRDRVFSDSELFTELSGDLIQGIVMRRADFNQFTPASTVSNQASL